MARDDALLAGYDMVAEAALIMGEAKYGFWAAGAVSTGSKKAGDGTRKDQLICSGLYANVDARVEPAHNAPVNQ